MCDSNLKYPKVVYGMVFQSKNPRPIMKVFTKLKFQKFKVKRWFGQLLVRLFNNNVHIFYKCLRKWVELSELSQLWGCRWFEK